jgi:hypothetical protein
MERTAMLRSLIYSIADLVSPKPSSPQGAEIGYQSQLRANVSALPMLESDRTRIGDEWLENLAILRDHILNDDPTEFLRWPMVMRTMFFGLRPYVLRELLFLRSHAWPRWKEAIRESSVGRPYRFPLYPASSANVIHYAYHLAQFEQATRIRVSDVDLILEFGGGYGGMCKLLRRLGYDGKYLIFDLPYFSELQRYFLQMNGLAVAQQPEITGANDVFCISDPQGLRVALAGLPANRKCMFIATWSLSEAPLEIRNAIVSMMDKITYFLIAYQGTFGGIDNRRFFANLAASRPDVSWTTQEIPHLASNAYLFGAVPA